MNEVPPNHSTPSSCLADFDTENPIPGLPAHQAGKSGRAMTDEKWKER
ncbi:hypothetical protein [Dictyobacter alpinus]|nr:hypothetical protein [Dictyobacter alpinus]